MFETGRTQIIVYVVIAAVLALVGFNSLRGGSGSSKGYEPAGGALTGGGATGTSAGTETGAGISVSRDRSKLVVDVSGGVRRPGVYEFAQGTRVIDAIRRAGGALPRALPGAINRAAELADGQQVVVPVATGGPGASASAVAEGFGPAPAAIADAPISLGSATMEQLE